MLLPLNVLQLVLYIALLALLGQGALHLLAGAARERNVFYRMLRTVGRPFARLVRVLAPARVADRHVPLLTFVVLLGAYLAVTFAKIALCLRFGMESCR